VFGVGVLVASFVVVFFLLPVAFPSLSQPGVASLTFDLVSRTVVGSLAFVLIPLSIGIERCEAGARYAALALYSPNLREHALWEVRELGSAPVH
jgi:hypothetical protein